MRLLFQVAVRAVHQQLEIPMATRLRHLQIVILVTQLVRLVELMAVTQLVVRLPLCQPQKAVVLAQ
jgi:hypothetical protein